MGPADAAGGPHRRALAVLGTPAWRAWIGPFLDGPGYDLDVVVAAGEAALLDAAARRPLDAVVILGRHDTLVRDFHLARRLELAGHRVVAHPERLVRLARDKRAMARLAERSEGFFPIPEMTPHVARRLLEAGALEAVVAKPNDGTEGRGLHVFREPAHVASTGTRLHEGGYLLQPFLSGEEISVVTVWHDGRCNVYAPVAKGRTSERGVHPSRRRRTCPAPLAKEDPLWRPLVRACASYLRPLAPRGPVELEFIRIDDRFFLLEINPRVAATFRLAAVASLRSPLADWLRAACGLEPLGTVVAARRCAVEWSLPPDLPDDVRTQARRLPDVWVSSRITVAAPNARALDARALQLRDLVGGQADDPA